MRLMNLVYLLSFFAPVAFLLGYIAGAPRPVDRTIELSRIDTRPLPASAIDFYRHENSMVVPDVAWLQPNSQLEVK